MNILLVYSPFCTPVTPPYSITNLAGFLKANTNHDIFVLDLNEKFHNLNFSEYKPYFKQTYTEKHETIIHTYNTKTKACYAKNNKKIRLGEKPDHFETLLNNILDQKPDIVAFSVVYSSQVFYTYALIQALQQRNIKTIIGGPAVNSKLQEISTHLCDEKELLKDIHEIIEESQTYFLDFSMYDLNDYFVKEWVLPLKTSTTCYYQQCSFCSHFSHQKYEEYSLEFLEETLNHNDCAHYFLIDDMIHPKRLLKLASLFKKHNITWACQLRPTIDFTQDILNTLSQSGLKFLMWGVESGNNRILQKINKGTNVQDIATVLRRSKQAGILNIAYIIFGFPSETKKEFLDTIHFLKENKDNIDLVSSSIFGLHQDTKIYQHPQDYSITNINVEPRTLLDSKITYEVKEGLTSEEANKLRKKYLYEINKINKFPYFFNFFREHTFFI